MSVESAKEFEFEELCCGCELVAMLSLDLGVWSVGWLQDEGGSVESWEQVRKVEGLDLVVP